MSLRRQRRKAERDWRRLRTDAARALFVSAHMAVVKQIFSCKVEHYQYQLALCKGDQRHTYMVLNSLLGRSRDPVMPSSMSDDELASCFSAFFTEKVDHIRSEIDAVVVDQEFSVDFSLGFNVNNIFSQFTPVTEADVLRYVKGDKKDLLPLRPDKCFKVGICI